MDDVEGVGDGKEVRCADHTRRYTRAELLYLPADVSKEGIAAPTADYMMVYTGTSFRYMAMADPLLREWVPISSEEKPSLSFPSAAAEALSFIRTASERM
eukprot:CAMPEP_0185804914 /NCGR_PEP_ID=MMETSP1322-20130828/3535_1 /TAXON_ID=265543 /ORGANISM="Minutocellus polymorphus, Strain RCC2270" /LENGTH=99 /DNA_ID=CAMNT_0028500911 /DNA_START=552 /DNA_END=852 /DNA_ORIENTATION=+